MTTIYWLIAFVVFVGIETVTLALTTIWFAGGALAGFLLSLAGFSVEIQLGAFVAVSFILLLCTRPFVSKDLNRSVTRTNVDSLVGKKARVTVLIDNDEGSGAAVVNGQEWMARALEQNKRFQPGETVVIDKIQGVKLIVKELKEEK